MSPSFAQILAEGPALLFDGAMATQLEARGSDLGGGLWSARCLREQPELVRAVHEGYLSAGADVLTTATYQLSYRQLSRFDLSVREVDALMKRALDLARDAAGACDRQVFIALSLGPYGAVLGGGREYDGDYGPVTARDLRLFHAPRLESARDAGAEIVILETCPRLDEAVLVAELADDLGIRDLVMSLQLRDPRRLGGGDDLLATIQELNAEGSVTAIGLNCCPPARATEALRLFGEQSLKPWIIQANSGEVFDGQSWRPAAEEVDIIREAERWLELGARGIGACCRSSPATIAAMRRLRT